MKEEKLSYEEAIKELEEIIKSLEKETISLDDSLEKFKKGIELYKYTNKLLSGAEGEIKILLDGPDGLLNEEDFFEEVEGDHY